MLDFEKASAKEIARFFSNEVNCLTFSSRDLASGLKDVPSLKDLDMYWIKTLSGTSYGTDGRNEKAAEVGKQLALVPFIQERMRNVSNDKMKEVASIMSHEHRTLQQSFSSFVFAHIEYTSSREEISELKEFMSSKFYILPFI